MARRILYDFTEAEQDRMLALYDDGLPPRVITERMRLECSPQTVWEHIKRAMARRGTGEGAAGNGSDTPARTKELAARSQPSSAIGPYWVRCKLCKRERLYWFWPDHCENCAGQRLDREKVEWMP